MIRLIVLTVFTCLTVPLLYAQQTDYNYSLTLNYHNQIPAVNNASSSLVLNEVVDLNFTNVSVEEALTTIAKAANLKLMYGKSILPSEDKRLTIKNKQMSIHDALWMVLEGTGLQFAVSPNRQLVLLRKKELKSTELPELIQETIRGTVIDFQTGEALPGVNIVVRGTTIGTTTNLDGEFTLDVPSLQETLVLSYIGYEQLIVNIDGRSEINFELRPDIQMLDDVVVVGYGTMQRSDVTGSVHSVTRREITEIGAYSMESVLQGRIPGANISAGGFRPGEGSTIRIRGTRSLTASNNPLIVMDGIPIEGGLMELNPNDVESIEVLKDASSTAIYGSRGANGVILITTRQGFDGFRVEYQGHAGPQWINNRLDLMNAEQYAQFARDAYIARDGFAPADEAIFDAWALESLRLGRSVDWQDLIFGRGYQQMHQISLLGGSSSTRYNISGTFDEHLSPVQNNDFRRITGRFNLDHTISSRIRFGISSHISNSLQYESVSFANVLRNSPMTNPYDADGNIRMYDDVGDRNPLFDMQRENNLNEGETTRLISSAYAEIQLIPEKLEYRGMFSPDFRFRNDGRYRMDVPFSTARAWERRSTSLVYENRLRYTETFLGVHRLDLTAVNSYQTFDQRATRIDVSGLPYEYQLFHNVGSADRVDLVSSSLSEWKLESYMLRANYSYDNRYVLTLTGRIDGSSRLSEGNKYGFFPSGAIAWNITNERFMQDNDFFSELKLRLSVGEVGNTAISPFQTLGQLQLVNNGYAFNDVARTYFEHGDIPNPDLKWERSRTYNLGLDWGIKDDRFRGTIEVYQTDTFDLLMNRQLPFTSGYTSTLENIGETQNRGIDFTLSTTNVHTRSFMWQTDFNVGYNRNKIVSLYGGFEDDPGSGWFIGKPISVIWYWDWDGIWQLGEEEQAAIYGAAPGDVRFVDQNNDGVIDDEDRIIRGDPFPNWVGGLTNRLTFKNFDMSAFVYASLGSTHYSPTHSSSFNDLLSLQFVAAQTNQMNVNYWMPDNPSNEYEK
ncbi:MAG: SusC/RagA family TonB-linked outer membrane protein, partial [Balneolaceae bacterium]|nr:SusC/RagA family TonB-linked outer membrane protein [Balneolaceae bacterium]